MRQLNELTLARFDAKLEHRIGILETKLMAAMARLEAKVETRLR